MNGLKLKWNVDMICFRYFQGIQISIHFFGIYEITNHETNEDERDSMLWPPIIDRNLYRLQREIEAKPRNLFISYHILCRIISYHTLQCIVSHLHIFLHIIWNDIKPGKHWSSPRSRSKDNRFATDLFPWFICLLLFHLQCMNDEQNHSHSWNASGYLYLWPLWPGSLLTPTQPLHTHP